MASETYRILVVDDIADNLLLLKTLLELENFTVDIADSGASAWATMGRFPPDLVLLDIMMPDMNGYELTRTIRQDGQLSSIPVILITAHVEACRIKGLGVGATDFIRKPIDFDALLAKIQSLLAYKDFNL